MKDVNQSLVDDNLVCCDKIGSGNFYWSFPSKAYQDLLQNEERLKANKTAIEGSIMEAESKIREATLSRQAKDRHARLMCLQQLLEEEKALDKRLEDLKGNDPEHIDRVVQDAKRCKLAADRWTDNIWIIKSHLTRKMGRSSKEVRNYFS